MSYPFLTHNFTVQIEDEIAFGKLQIFLKKHHGDS